MKGKEKLKSQLKLYKIMVVPTAICIWNRGTCC